MSMFCFRAFGLVGLFGVLFSGFVLAQSTTGPRSPEDSAVWNTPIEFVMLDEQPRPLNMEEVKRALVYPRECRNRRIEGKVILRVLVNQQGTYVRHLVLQSPDTLLSEAVEEHISELRFTPAKKNGRAIATWLIVPFDFQLGASDRQNDPDTDTPPQRREPK